MFPTNDNESPDGFISETEINKLPCIEADPMAWETFHEAYKMVHGKAPERSWPVGDVMLWLEARAITDNSTGMVIGINCSRVN